MNRDRGDRQLLPSLERLSRAECFDLLPKVSVGRVGVSVSALPTVLPVNFVMFDGDVLIRTAAGTKLTAATANAVVAFEVDDYAPDGANGWSVVVQGVASEVTDPDELDRVRATPLDSWALDGVADHFIRIKTSHVSGRRFFRRPVD